MSEGGSEWINLLHKWARLFIIYRKGKAERDQRAKMKKKNDASKTRRVMFSLNLSLSLSLCLFFFFLGIKRVFSSGTPGNTMQHMTRKKTHPPPHKGKRERTQHHLLDITLAN